LKPKGKGKQKGFFAEVKGKGEEKKFKGSRIGLGRMGKTGFLKSPSFGLLREDLGA